MFVTIAALSLAAAQPAALDPDVACIADRIPAATRRSMLDEASTGQRGSVRALVEAAAVDCARERAWSAEAANWFDHMAAAQMLVVEASNRLRSNGFSPDLVTGWFRAQPLEARLGYSGNQSESESVNRHLVAAGITDRQLDENFQSIGVLLAALQAVERLEAARPD